MVPELALAVPALWAERPANCRRSCSGWSRASRPPSGCGRCMRARGRGRRRRAAPAAARDHPRPARRVHPARAPARAHARGGELPEDEQRALAQLTADIHAPLANRLGIWQLKWELEDLAFRYLQPDVYRRIAHLLDERRGDREGWIASAQGATARARWQGRHQGRHRRPAEAHLFDLAARCSARASSSPTLYDVRALRVLVDDVADCYAALGVVHTLWPSSPSEFDDYIAQPEGQPLPVAAHGRDRPGGQDAGSADPHARDAPRTPSSASPRTGATRKAAAPTRSFERKIAWMRQLLESKDARDDDAALLAGFRTEVVEDRVYLLTPKGQVIDLPRGATVLDFAYSIHTDVGHRCRGAKVNGRIVPLTLPAGKRRPRRDPDRQDDRAAPRLAVAASRLSSPRIARARRCARGSSASTTRRTSPPAARCSSES